MPPTGSRQPRPLPAGAALPAAPVVTPELRQLRYFVAVAQHGSFARAAQDLNVTEQAISQQITALESAIGLTLLRRTSGRLEITPAGEAFLAYCPRILSGAERAVRRAREAAARYQAGGSEPTAAGKQQ